MSCIIGIAKSCIRFVTMVTCIAVPVAFCLVVYREKFAKHKLVHYRFMQFISLQYVAPFLSFGLSVLWFFFIERYCYSVNIVVS